MHHLHDPPAWVKKKAKREAKVAAKKKSRVLVCFVFVWFLTRSITALRCGKWHLSILSSSFKVATPNQPLGAPLNSREINTPQFTSTEKYVLQPLPPPHLPPPKKTPYLISKGLLLSHGPRNQRQATHLNEDIIFGTPSSFVHLSSFNPFHRPFK